MIQEVERHLCQWIATRLARLAAGSALFRDVTPLPGSADPAAASLSAGQAAVLCRIDSCQVVPTGEQVGMRAPEAGEELHLTLGGSLCLVGPAEDLVEGGVGAVSADPAEAKAHQIDVLLLAALAGLREQLQARADGMAANRPESLRGWIELAAGDRRLRLTWDGGTWEPMQLAEHDGWRSWACRLTLRARARLSPDAPSGGRILGIAASLGADLPVQIYAPAEALTLDHFSGLPAELRTELADHELTTLGDLARLGPDQVDTLPLRCADAAARQALVTLARVAELRTHAAELPVAGQMAAELLALDVNALLAPSDPQRAVLDRYGTSLPVRLRMAALALVLAPLISPERRTAVRIGNLLTVPRSKP